MVVPLAENSQLAGLVPGVIAPNRTVSVVPNVSFICDASVRCQINR